MTSKEGAEGGVVSATDLTFRRENARAITMGFSFERPLWIADHKDGCYSSTSSTSCPNLSGPEMCWPSSCLPIDEKCNGI